MDNGFIQLHRKIIKWEWYEDANTFRLFIHLLLLANHENGRWQGHEIKRGQLITGRKILSKSLMISQQSIRTSLEHLKSTNEITIKPTSKFSLITIIKYDDYQSDKRKSTNQSTNKLTNNQPATNQQLTTNNNVNNVNNVNNENKYNNILQPAVAEVLPELLNSKQRHIQIIGLWAKAKKVTFTGKEQQTSFIARNLRAATNLVPYEPQKIIDTMAWLLKNADFKITLETVGKYIDEDLSKLKTNKPKLTIL